MVDAYRGATSGVPVISLRDYRGGTVSVYEFMTVEENPADKYLLSDDLFDVDYL